MNQDAHDNWLEQYEDNEPEVKSARQELLETLIVHKIDKNVFVVERERSRNCHHIVALHGDKYRCSCAWAIFSGEECVHVSAVKESFYFQS